MAFMNFNRIGIFEQDGERVGLRPLEITTNWGENPILRAEVLSFFNESNALRRNKDNSKIKKVIFNNPATIVIWSDNTKTIVKCQPGDIYSEELGLAMCISKKYLGNKGNFNNEFKKWLPEEIKREETKCEETLSIEEKRKAISLFCMSRGCDKCPLEDKQNCYHVASDKEIEENYKLINSMNKED